MHRGGIAYLDIFVQNQRRVDLPGTQRQIRKIGQVQNRGGFHDRHPQRPHRPFLTEGGGEDNPLFSDKTLWGGHPQSATVRIDLHHQFFPSPRAPFDPIGVAGLHVVVQNPRRIGLPRNQQQIAHLPQAQRRSQDGDRVRGRQHLSIRGQRQEGQFVGTRLLPLRHLQAQPPPIPLQRRYHPFAAGRRPDQSLGSPPGHEIVQFQDLALSR